MMQFNSVPREFFMQDTIEVARGMLGKILWHKTPSGPLVAGKIVETEAYLGAEDPACHSFNYRRTPRTETMYLSGGHSYVYFIYGMYFCFNVVTGDESSPEAVLVRAVEPLEGLAHMKRRRLVKRSKDLTNGPGKLCLAMEITKAQNALNLLNSTMGIADSDNGIDGAQILSTPRVGIGNDHDAVHWPLRFLVKDNPYVSGAKI